MDTGCYGSGFYETPNIDKLAAQGMRFTDGYAACAVCSPTRAAVMTGRYPARLGVTDWIRSRFQGDAAHAARQRLDEFFSELSAYQHIWNQARASLRTRLAIDFDVFNYIRPNDPAPRNVRGFVGRRTVP